jgi:hypothetical protein
VGFCDFLCILWLNLNINYDSAPLAVAIARDFAATELHECIGHGVGLAFPDAA